MRAFNPRLRPVTGTMTTRRTRARDMTAVHTASGRHHRRPARRLHRLGVRWLRRNHPRSRL